MKYLTNLEGPVILNAMRLGGKIEIRKGCYSISDTLLDDLKTFGQNGPIFFDSGRLHVDDALDKAEQRQREVGLRPVFHGELK